MANTLEISQNNGNIYSSAGRQSCLLTLCALMLVASSVSGQTREATGFFHPPGSGTDQRGDPVRIPYRITAQRVPGLDHQVTLWVDVTNDTKSPISFIACAMLRLKGNNQLIPNYLVTKEEPNPGQPGGAWKCERAAEDVKRPPSFHFGCKRVSLAPGQSANIFDEVATFDQAVSDDALSSVYWDVLRDCPLDSSCDAVRGQNVNLQPRTARHIVDTVNIWAGRPFPFPQCLRPSASTVSQGSPVCSRFWWDAGNWITMAFPDAYPARLQARISHAHVGDLFTLTLPGDTVRQFAAPPGGSFFIDEPFIIPPEIDAIVELERQTNNPSPNPVRFEGQVVAESGNPIYAPGQLMYQVATNFVRDERPPRIVRVEATRDNSSNRLRFRVEATDSTTMPAAASVSLSIGGGPDVVFPLNFDAPAVVGNRVIFTGESEPVPQSVAIMFRVHVTDEAGNIATSLGTLP